MHDWRQCYKTFYCSNEGKSAANFYWQVAALVPDMLSNFYFMQNHTIAISLVATEAREKISTYLKSLGFHKFFDAYLTKFKNYQILHNKINHRFLLTAKQFSG